MRKRICLPLVCVALGMLSLLRSAGSFACTSGLIVPLPAPSAPLELLKSRAGGHPRLRSPCHPPFHCAIQTYCPDPARPQVQTLSRGVSAELAIELLEFGAVWIALPEQGSKNQHGVGKTRRASTDEALPAGSYLRVHVNPKRHLRATQVDWASRIIDKTPDFIVVDKPQGVPTVPTVDNLKESVLYQVSQLLNEQLLVTSRLDKCTSGVLVLARSPEACEEMNRSLRDRNVDKTYRLLCYKPLALGTLRHLASHRKAGHKNAKPELLRSFDEQLLEKSEAAGGAHSRSEWQLAEMVVLSCTEWTRPPSQTPNAADRDQAFASTAPNPASSSSSSPQTSADGAGSVASSDTPMPPLYECEVRLITGRTHQVRLQVAAAGGGIVGDSRYLPVVGLLQDEAASAHPHATSTGPRPHQHRPIDADGDVSSASALSSSSSSASAASPSNLSAPPEPEPEPVSFGPEPDVVALQAFKLCLRAPASPDAHDSPVASARADPAHGPRASDAAERGHALDGDEDEAKDASDRAADSGASALAGGSRRWRAGQAWWEAADSTAALHSILGSID